MRQTIKPTTNEKYNQSKTYKQRKDLTKYEENKTICFPNYYADTYTEKQPVKKRITITSNNKCLYCFFISITSLKKFTFSEFYSILIKMKNQYLIITP